MASFRLALVVALLQPVIAAPEIVCALGPGAAAYKAASDERPSPDTMQLAGRLNTAVKTICGQNCPTMALFRNTTAPNVMLINNSGEAKIVYAPPFFAMVYDKYGDAGITALLAHVLGHALDGTLGAAWIKNTWTPELRADAWAGCILARSSSEPAVLAAALGTLETYPAPTHPAWIQRLPVIRTGYVGCGGTAAQFDKPGKTPGAKR
jgi:hypothetical protein